MGRSQQKIKTKGETVPMINISLVGDSMVGKTSLLFARSTKEYPPTPFCPMVMNFGGIFTVDGQDYSVGLHDSQPQEEYDRLRPLLYPISDCIILCFSVNSRQSFINIKNKWIPEIRNHCRRKPMVLLATKTDLRNNPMRDGDNKEDEVKDLIQSDEGKELCVRINAARYLECSAKKMEGLQEVFEEAIRCISEEPRSKWKVCKIL